MCAIAVAGLGTVGGGVSSTAGTERCGSSPARAGQAITVAAVSARDRGKDRGVALEEGVHWAETPQELATLPGIDAVVELIGGQRGRGAGLVLQRRSRTGGQSSPRTRR